MKYAPALFSTAILFSTSAQQPAQLTQFWNIQMQTNPAYTGLLYKHAANITNYVDWGGYYGDNGLYASYAMRIDKIKSGIGVSYSFDKWGTACSHTAQLHLAHHFKTGEQSSISAGLAGGIRSFAFTSSPWKLLFSDYYAVADINAGLAYHWKDLNIGVSLVQVNEPVLEARHNNSHYDLPMSCWLNADYTFHLNEKLDLRPQVQVAVYETYSDQTFSVMTILNKRFWAGVNYNYGDYLGIMVGYDIREQFRIGVSQDFYTDKYYYQHNGNTGNLARTEIVFSYLLK